MVVVFKVLEYSKILISTENIYSFMFRVYPRRRYYAHPIILEQPKMDNWIKNHGYASRDWIESNVRYGFWGRKRKCKCDRRSIHNHFQIYPEVIIGDKRKRVVIKFIHYLNGNPSYPYNHVYVYHAHDLGER